MSLKILTHMCCGPCSIMPFIKFIQKGFNPIGFFFNTNIHPLNEYIRRRNGAEECAKILKVKVIFKDEAWNFNGWISNYINYIDKETRCIGCISSRLEETFIRAKQEKINYVSTTLLYSIYQPHMKIKKIGEELQEKYNINFLYEDFRIYFGLGEKLSREWKIYRQGYCGCIFSEIEKNSSKLHKLITKQ